MSLKHSYQFEAIGTHWSIETAAALTGAEMRHIHKIIDDFDSTYSRFRADSLVWRARSEAPGSFAFPASIAALHETYAQLERVTQGAVNPLVGDTLEHLGYDATYSLRPTRSAATKPQPLSKTIKRKGTTLTYNKPALLDIGAIGKGFLVDQVAAYVTEHHEQYVIDAGGDMTIVTDQPYVIGLENPWKLGEALTTVSLQHGSMCGSAPNRRTWGDKLHHIIDARTGDPADGGIIATWAIADTTMLADALATALFFAPAEVLQQQFGGFRYAIMKANSHLEHNLTNT